MLKKLSKIGACVIMGIGLTAVLTYKNIAHNVMSHHPTDMTSKEIIEDLPKILFTKGWYDGIPDEASCVPKGTDMNAIYLEKQKNPFPESPYKPASASIPKNTALYNPSCMIDFGFSPKSLEKTTANILKRIKEMKPGDIVPLKEEGNQYDPYYWDYGEGLIDMQKIGPIEGFGHFTMSVGYDSGGKYFSFFDVFDFGSGKGGYYTTQISLKDKIASNILPKLGKPIHFYKRWYFKDVGITDKVLEDVLSRKTEKE
jgi:hypothetical protein